MARGKKRNRKPKKHVYFSKGKRRHGARRGSTVIHANLSGIKKSLAGGKPVLYTALGGLVARALYGLGCKYTPTTDPRLIGAGAVLATILAGIAISGKKAVAIPLAVGAAGMGVIDMFADEIAKAVPATHPEVAQAILTGVGKPMYALPVATFPLDTGAATTDVALSGYYPNQFGMGERLPNQFGIGDTDMVYY